MTAITASMLYDLVHCPNGPAMGLYGDASGRDQVNVFVQLLWARGSVFEKECGAAIASCKTNWGAMVLYALGNARFSELPEIYRGCEVVAMGGFEPPTSAL